MFERPASGEQAVLVQLDFGEGDYAERLDEFRLLVGSAGATPRAEVRGKRRAPDAATYAGKGKVAEIKEAKTAADADIVIFNHQLSAAQQRNLERELACRVIDRNALILDISCARLDSPGATKGRYRPPWSRRKAA
jgi:GTPase